MSPKPNAKMVEDLTTLIAFDTTSRNSNLALIDWVAERLARHGASIRLDHNADRTKANLFATFGEGEGGIVLSGHTDVVPVDGQEWTSDPFRADLRDARIYGRGACDMKAFIAGVCATAPEFLARPLREPLHVALTYDEEMGCLGIPGLLADMKAAGIAPTGCIVGEPTGMRVVSAHKGGRIYRCRVHGHSAHSSLTPHGVNAIEHAALIIAHIQSLAEGEAKSGVQDYGFDVPFSTISTNLIAGGNGANIIPAECAFTFEYRFLPGVSPDYFIDAIKAYVRSEVEPRMQARRPGAGVDFDLVGAIPALEASERDEILKLAVALARDNDTTKVAYGTEASFFQEVGVPSVVCGPGRIEQAHKPDEYVELAQLAACEHFLLQLVSQMQR